MRRLAALAAALIVLATLPAPATAAEAAQQFEGTISIIRKPLRKKMVSWRAGCPVHITDLRLVTVTHRGFDGKTKTGKLVVHEDVAAAIVSVMRSSSGRALSDPPDEARRRLWRQRLSLDRGGQHVRLQLPLRRRDNPLVGARLRTGDRRQPDREPLRERRNDVASGERPYLDRSKRKKGMIHGGDAVVRAFRSIGWGWGGYWSGVKDYQHFSAGG